MRLSRPIKSLIGRWLPFGDIYRRSDIVDEQVRVLFDRVVNVETSIENLNEVDHRLQQAIAGFRQHPSDQGDFAVERSIEVTLQIVGEVQSQIISDLRAEAKSQGDFAVERSIEVTEQIVGEVQSQIISDLRAEAKSQGDFAVERSIEVTEQIVGEVQSQIVSDISAELAAIRRQVRALETAQPRDTQAVPPSLNRSEIYEPSSQARSSLISDALYAGIEDVVQRIRIFDHGESCRVPSTAQRDRPHCPTTRLRVWSRRVDFPREFHWTNCSGC